MLRGQIEGVRKKEVVNDAKVLMELQRTEKAFGGRKEDLEHVKFETL